MQIVLETKNIKKMGLTACIVYSYFWSYPNNQLKEVVYDTGLSYTCVNKSVLDLETAGYIKVERLSDKKHSKIIGVEILK